MDLNAIIRSDNASNIQLVICAKDLRDLLDGAIAFAKQEIKERDEPDYYTREELAGKLHVSLVTLNRWRQSGKLPEPVIIEGRVLFNKAAVRDTLNNNTKALRKLRTKNITL